MRSNFISALGGFIVIAGCAFFSVAIDANPEAFLLAVGAILGGCGFIARAFGLEDPTGSWERRSRFLTASALGGGYLAGGLAALGLFENSGEAGAQ